MEKKKGLFAVDGQELIDEFGWEYDDLFGDDIIENNHCIYMALRAEEIEYDIGYLEELIANHCAVGCPQKWAKILERTRRWYRAAQWIRENYDVPEDTHYVYILIWW